MLIYGLIEILGKIFLPVYVFHWFVLVMNIFFLDLGSEAQARLN